MIIKQTITLIFQYPQDYLQEQEWLKNKDDKWIHKSTDTLCSIYESETSYSIEPQTIRCPKCGRTDYIRDMEKDMGVKGSHYKYKCINCNTYIKGEPQTERGE